MEKNLVINNIQKLYIKFNIKKGTIKKIIKNLSYIYTNTEINDNSIKYIANIILIIFIYKSQDSKLIIKILNSFIKLNNILQKELISFINSINTKQVEVIHHKLITHIIFTTINFFKEINNNDLAFKLLNDIIICTIKINNINSITKSVLYLQYIKQILQYIKENKENSIDLYKNTIGCYNKLICNLNDWIKKN